MLPSRRRGAGLFFTAIAVALFAAAPARPVARQLSIEVLHDFTYRPGAPTGTLVRGPDGTLSGLAPDGAGPR